MYVNADVDVCECGRGFFANWFRLCTFQELTVQVTELVLHPENVRHVTNHFDHIHDQSA